MKNNSSFELQEFFPYKLVKVADLVSRGFSEIYTKEFDITRAEWRLIAAIGEHQPVAAKELVEITYMDKVKVSRGLQKMEQKNLIEKQSAEFDQRSVLVMLTEEGEQLFGKLIPKATEWEAELLNALSAAEYKDLSMSLNRLVQQLEDMNKA
ncbi:MarR family transcriptional regulator [Photobacterium sanctipauli]|uniref:MarR family transcriptional regulator n=1 Tax=Photobacterium sanctipauli TaxID=1342794 RepID=A0A2T3P0C6_9GAMM|nr:MarR family transcriptional regulator [Photobacterium sanctipauli]PSW21971.1 MarR family transcriptional regulator [Photobacterium sanctipauli]